LSEPYPTNAAGWRLKLIVLVAGAVLMGLEMTGSRVLAIYFGSSIYVWGAIISIFLASLSIGYYAGGLIADRRPTSSILNTILIVAGVWLLLVPFYSNRVCRGVLALSLGERFGPLAATIILFGGPSILLGMVSPYAVRLAARSIEGLGNVAGKLYALSTFGSIIGTLLTAFWLIPALGARTLLQVMGVALLVSSLAVIAGSRVRKVANILLILASPGVLLLHFGAQTQARANQTLLYEGDSAYHYILVVDDAQRGARYLQFNNYIEGGIDLNPPHDTRVSYTNAFQLSRLFKRQLARVLIIGGGGGIGARKFVNDDPNVIVDQVEIDPKVVEMSYKYFYLEAGPRLRVHVEDGRHFVRRAQEKYDLVVLDAFTIGGQIPFHLTTKEFMQEIQGILLPGGVVLANINGALVGSRSRIMRAEYKTMSTVFSSVHLFPHLADAERGQSAPLNPNRARNLILVAVNGPGSWTRETIVRLALQLQSAGLVMTPTFLEDAAQYVNERPVLDDVPVLTDDYAPVDTMVF
jgi:spermidine synthase